MQIQQIIIIIIIIINKIIKVAGEIIKSQCEEQSKDRDQYKKEVKEKRFNGWHDKVMNGQHLRQTEEIAAKETWMWMKRGSLKR